MGANLQNYDSMMVLSHFKGHAMGGFGGAIKNISIGIGSSDGQEQLFINLLVNLDGSVSQAYNDVFFAERT